MILAHAEGEMAKKAAKKAKKKGQKAKKAAKQAKPKKKAAPKAAKKKKAVAPKPVKKPTRAEEAKVVTEPPDEPLPPPVLPTPSSSFTL